MKPQLSLCVATTVLLLASGCTSAPPSPAPEQRAAGPQSFSSTGPVRSSRHRSNNATSAEPGDFDFYLLNLSWSPEFCFHHSDSPECAAHPGFVVHGLWPENIDGTYPEHCSDAPGPSNPNSYTDLEPTVSLVEHEWTTHGTCSGLSPDAYFGLMRRARAKVRIPDAFNGSAQPRSETPDAILDQFTRINTGIPSASFALTCGNNYLTAIEVCFDKNLNAVACQGVRSCRANSVRITSRRLPDPDHGERYP